MIVGLLVLVAAVAAGTPSLASQHLLQDKKTTANSTVSCNRTGVTHVVSIVHNVASPSMTYGKLCDKLQIINYDNQIRLMAFGPHDDHQAYDGVVEEQLASGQSLTVTMDQAGTFHFHDHIGDVAQGDFTVSQ